MYGVKIPTGNRQREVIAPSQEAGSLDELRVILGNIISIKAYQEGTLPFPDGAMLAKVAWKRVPSAGDDAALGSPQAFVPGAATTVQIMVKDSKNTQRRVAGVLAGSSMANRSTRPSMRRVSRATRYGRKGTICSLRNTHIDRLSASVFDAIRDQLD